MSPTAKPDIEEKDLHGLKHFKVLMPVLKKLHDVGCRRDKASNRILHYDQYAALIPLYFFNPIVTSLRGIRQASQLEKVQRILKCQRASLGSLSEAAHVFDPDLMVGIIGELVHQLPVSNRPTNPVFNSTTASAKIRSAQQRRSSWRAAGRATLVRNYSGGGRCGGRPAADCRCGLGVARMG